MPALYGVYYQNKITVSTVAVGLTLPTTGLKPMGAQLKVEDQPIRWTSQPGYALSATNGNLAVAGAELWLADYVQIKHFRAIREGGADAEIGYQFGSDFAP